MILNRKIVWAIYLGIVVAFIVWWVWGVEKLSPPHSPLAGIVYTSVVLFAGWWHVKAVIRFSRMTKLIRMQEHAGIAEPGSTSFAANQRFRYIMRVGESVVVLAIGILAILATYYPEIQLNPNYFKLVISYFVGSILLTGILTIRDLWVLDAVKKLQKSNVDDVALKTIIAANGHE